MLYLDIFDGGIRSRNSQAASIGAFAVHPAELDLMDCQTKDAEEVRPPGSCIAAAEMRPDDASVHRMIASLTSQAVPKFSAINLPLSSSTAREIFRFVHMRHHHQQVKV